MTMCIFLCRYTYMTVCTLTLSASQKDHPQSKGVQVPLRSLLWPRRQGLQEALTQADRSVNKCIGRTSAAFMHARQSTYVEDSLQTWRTVYNSALAKGKHTTVLVKHHSSLRNSMMAPGDGLELSIKVEGWEGVDTILHCFAHGRMAQDAPNLRWLHVLNKQTRYMP